MTNRCNLSGSMKLIMNRSHCVARIENTSLHLIMCRRLGFFGAPAFIRGAVIKMLRTNLEAMSYDDINARAAVERTLDREGGQ